MTVSTVGSKAPCRHVRHLQEYLVERVESSAHLQFSSSCSKHRHSAAKGQYSLPTSACLSSRRICVLRLFTATSTRPFARIVSRCTSQHNATRVGPFPQKFVTPIRMDPSDVEAVHLEFEDEVHGGFGDFLCSLVIIGAARRKILMSKPPVLGFSSPSFFSGGGKR